MSHAIQRGAFQGVPTVQDLFEHPLSFAIGIGVANGILAVSRNKTITPRAVMYLALILGAGEAALAAEEPPEERTKTLTEIALYSILGVFVGVAPFADWKGTHRAGGALPVATANPPGTQSSPGLPIAVLDLPGAASARSA